MIDWNKLPHYPFLNDILNETIYGWSKFFSSVFYWSKVNLIFWLCASSNALTWMLWLWVLFLDPTKYLAQNCWKEWCQYVFQSFITDVLRPSGPILKESLRNIWRSKLMSRMNATKHFILTLSSSKCKMYFWYFLIKMRCFRIGYL